MSFESGTYASSLGLPLANASGASRGPLTQQEAGILTSKLENDSQKLIYSSLLSIADAFRGLELGYTTWPTVKFYYSCFYSVRAILALSNVCLYYEGKKGRWLESISGRVPAKSPNRAGGSTHKFAFLIFEQLFPSSPILSQSIDNFPPFEWFMSRREDANYNIARFVEPSENPNFCYLKKGDIRKLCVQYLRDDHLAFDPDHAVMAFPLFLLNHIKSLGVRGATCVQSVEENKAYEAYFSDRFGHLRPMLEIKNSIIL